MTKPNYWLARTSLTLLFCLALASATLGQTTARPTTECALCFFSASPERQIYAHGEAVVLVLSIYNASEEPIFVSRLKGGAFVDLDVIGPDGKEAQWQGRRRTDSKSYAPSDFTVLEKYHEISVKKVISLKDGAGFVFDGPGEYFVTAEYSLGSTERFSSFAGGTKIPSGIFRSTRAGFCIEACILQPLRVGSNVPQSAIDAVRVFYTRITRYRPLGLPYGNAKRALWPLLSKRLVEDLDSLQACGDDYYRRYGEILRRNTYKGAIPWQEDGLFTGPNDAATPLRFSIVSSRAIGENRVDVQLRFPEPNNCCGRPTSYYYTDGVVTVILENNRWVVDDFVAMYENDDLTRLSDGYAECKAGRWIGEPY